MGRTRLGRSGPFTTAVKSARRVCHRMTTRPLRTIAILTTVAAVSSAAVVGAAPDSSAAAVSSDCDNGTNINDGTISGTYVKVKTLQPSPSVLWVCYLIDRQSDPVVHDGGKVQFDATTSPVLDSNAGYCATRPGYISEIDVTIGPDSIPLFVRSVSPADTKTELGLCIRVGDGFLFRASAAGSSDSAGELTRDAVTCSQITGTVMDIDGNPISGASVQQIQDTIEGCASSATTSATGTYALQARTSLPAQEVTLRAQAAGRQAEDLVVVAAAGSGLVQADFNLFLDVTTWTDPGCWEDGNPLAGSDPCIPPARTVDDSSADAGDPCSGTLVCDGSLQDLINQGTNPASAAAIDAMLTALAAEDDALAQPPSAPTGLRGPDQADTPRFATFFWFESERQFCDETPYVNGHCAFFLFTRDENGRHYYSKFAARSGNNRPQDECVQNKGPIEVRNAPAHNVKWHYYTVGYMEHSFSGYESSGANEFYPGEWRLDPWTVSKCYPYDRNNPKDPTRKDRSSFAIHGGRNGHTLWDNIGTQGCVRLWWPSIDRVKTMWNNFGLNHPWSKHVRLYLPSPSGSRPSF